jgi:rhodanese-related sulfurtransferase
MQLRKLDALAWTITATLMAASGGGLVFAQAAAAPQATAAPKASAAIEFMSASELKARVSANQPVTIVDVRDSNSYEGNPERIKGAIHVRLRRLKSRLAQQPLKDLPRDQQVVTYCACPADEAGIRAAQVFLDAGFKRVRILKGGWVAWLEAGGPVERTPKL